MIRDKVLSYLSLAAKAGRLCSGSFLTERAVRDGRAVLVIAAADASENTRKKLSDLCAHHRIPMTLYADKAKLGRAIGRAETAAVTVTDRGFADQIGSLLTDGTTGG